MSQRITKQVAVEWGFELAVFAACAAEIVLLYAFPFLLAAVLALTAVATWAFWREGQYWCVFFVGAAVGGVGETICANAGAWQYTHPTFLGIPVWLPVAWGLVSMLIKGISETFVKLRAK